MTDGQAAVISQKLATRGPLMRSIGTFPAEGYTIRVAGKKKSWNAKASSPNFVNDDQGQQ